MITWLAVYKNYFLFQNMLEQVKHTIVLLQIAKVLCDIDCVFISLITAVDILLISFHCLNSFTKSNL